MKQENPADASYVVFATGGKQYQGIPGKTIAIEKIEVEPGESVEFKDVLVRKVVNEEGKSTIEVGHPYLDTPITASVVKHIKGPKITIFHFKRRKGYKRKMGHRQPYTVVRIESI